MNSLAAPDNDEPLQEPPHWLERIEIRRLAPQESGMVSALQELSLRELSVGYYSDNQIEAIIEAQNDGIKLRLSGERCYGAFHQDALLGLVCLTRLGITGLYCHPRIARQGLGRRLMTHAEQEAQRLSWYRLEVVASLTAVEFYQKLGYRPYIIQSQQTVNCANIHIPVVSLYKELPRPESTSTQAAVSSTDISIALFTWCFFVGLSVALIRR